MDLSLMTGKFGSIRSFCEVMDMREEKVLRKIFDSLDDNEQFGLSFGLFPLRLEKYNFDKEETVSLIEMSQEKTGVEC